MFNPHPPKVFFVTRPPKGGGRFLQPLPGFSIRNSNTPIFYDAVQSSISTVKETMASWCDFPKFSDVYLKSSIVLLLQEMPLCIFHFFFVFFFILLSILFYFIKVELLWVHTWSMSWNIISYEPLASHAEITLWRQQPQMMALFLAFQCYQLLCIKILLTEDFGQEHKTLELFLDGGPDETSGYVKVRYGNAEGYICGHKWDMTDANIACNSMGLGNAISALSGPGTALEVTI